MSNFPKNFLQKQTHGHRSDTFPKSAATSLVLTRKGKPMKSLRFRTTAKLIFALLALWLGLV
jgi:hypothetical protein